MKQYLKYLEAQTHILHPEELSTRGIDDLRRAIKIFQTMRDEFVNLSAHSITTKWDGAPAIVCGINPENNKFFVSTKSALNKEPKVCYNKDDIIHFTNNVDLQNKLMSAMHYLSQLNIKGIIQGDLLFTEESKQIKTIDGEENIVFKANTITYAALINSPTGQQINKAKLGIVFHTKYTGKLNNLTKSSLSPNEVPQSTSDVFSINPEITKDAPTLSSTEKDSVTTNLKEIGTLFHILSKEFYVKMEEYQIKDSIEKAINNYIKNESLPDNVDQFAVDVIKAALSKSNKKSMQAENFIKDFKQQFIALFKIYKLLYDTKIVFVRALEKISNNVKAYTQDDKGFKITNPEGFVLTNTSTGNMIKLVDRLNFSKNNFNFIKNWGK